MFVICRENHPGNLSYEVQHLHSRRDFLKLLGFAVGATLTGCSDGNDSFAFGGGIPLSNAYQFTPIVTSGGTLPGRSLIRAQASGGELPFTGAAMLNDRRHVFFHALDESGLDGVYRLDYDTDGSLSELRMILREGDTLPDGTVVDEIAGGALNDSDDSAFVVKDPQGRQSLQYSPEEQGFTPLLTSYENVSQEAKLQGTLHPEVALSQGGDLLFCCNYRGEDDFGKGEGLFYLPKGRKSETKLILSQNQLLPGTRSAIESFGLFDLLNDGSYLVSGSAELLEGEERRNGGPPTYMLRGRIGEEPEVLFAHADLGAGNVIPGSVYMAPRLGLGGTYGAVVQTTPEETALWVNGEKLLDAECRQGGALSPKGSKIISMFPPVLGPNGIIALVVYTLNGSELLVSQGGRFQTILASGDVVAGKEISTILFGALPDCVNNNGELVAVTYHTDGSSALLLGMPI